MTAFILAAAALSAVALALLLRPWWRTLSASRAASADSRELNAAIYRDQLAELDRDRAGGELSEADFAEAHDEIRRRVLEDAGGEQATGPTPASSRATWLSLLVALPLLAGVLYAWLGNPAANLSAEERDRQAAASMEQMVVKLAQRVEREPGNAEARAMLARSYKMLGRFDEAERVFAGMGSELQQNATLLAEYAETLVQKAGGSFAGRPRELVTQALHADPDHGLALLLAGTDAFESRRWADAVGYWERLMKQLEPGSEDAQLVEQSLARARAQLAKVGAGGTARQGGKVAKAAVSGRVELAPALRQKASPDDVVFIFARAVDGPRMPLAAQRARVADLPLEFSLDDRQALNAELVISAARTLRIEARVAKSGNVTAAKGDLAGQSTVVKPGTRGVRVLIDNIVE